MSSRQANSETPYAGPSVRMGRSEAHLSEWGGRRTLVTSNIYRAPVQALDPVSLLKFIILQRAFIWIDLTSGT